MARPCRILRPNPRLFSPGNANMHCRKAYISFGGLLMSLEGPYKKLTPLRVEYTYLLVKK